MILKKIKSRLIKDNLVGRIISYFYTLLKRPNHIQKRKNYGDKNPKKTIYVIRPDTDDCIQGLMSLFVQSIRKIKYAKQNKYIPYIDYKTYKTQYYDKGINSWEYFFTQPSKLSYEEVYQSKNVILSGISLNKTDDYKLFKDTIFQNEKLCDECYHLIWDNIDLSNEAKIILEEENRKLRVENCIGLYLRGTDYIKLKPSGEYIQPNIEQILEKVEEFINKYPKANIFLVTEDKYYYDYLKEKYQDKIIIVSFDSFIDNYNKKTFLSKSGKLIKNSKIKGMNYLIKIVLLSKCKYLISSITYGSIASYAMNGNKYEDKYIFNLGKYK